MSRTLDLPMGSWEQYVPAVVRRSIEGVQEARLYF